MYILSSMHQDGMPEMPLNRKDFIRNKNKQYRQVKIMFQTRTFPIK